MATRPLYFYKKWQPAPAQDPAGIQSHFYLSTTTDMDSTEELDVIIVGAGLSGRRFSYHPSNKTNLARPGVCALVRLQQKFPNANIAVFEKGDNVGGTWAKNTYPGLSCDIPSQVCLPICTH